MKIYRYPSEEIWPALAERAVTGFRDKFPVVEEVLAAVRNRGDAAVREYTLKFDKAEIETLQVTPEEILEARNAVDPLLAGAIQAAAANIRSFHEAQMVPATRVVTAPGVTCWQKSVPVEKVGLYIPGGSAPLFSTVLMLAIPANIAGCGEIILCSPPGADGKINPAILYAASLCQVTKMFKIGGIQAIGAMAYGTGSVPAVHKIFGPGNSWVMAAKQLVSLDTCSIDMPAGPSELVVVADSTASPAFVASDLLSQSEHGPDSQVLLVTNDPLLPERVLAETERQLALLPRRETATQALSNSRIILLETMEMVMKMVNLYAPEHLILQADNAALLAEKVTSAGSVFIGHYTPESAGDYASGTNHTLPTSGWARSVSGLNLDSFCKKITCQEITKEGLAALGPVIETMAEAEQLLAHRNAVSIRLGKPAGNSGK